MGNLVKNLNLGKRVLPLNKNNFERKCVTTWTELDQNQIALKWSQCSSFPVKFGPILFWEIVTRFNSYRLPVCQNHFNLIAIQFFIE